MDLMSNGDIEALNGLWLNELCEACVYVDIESHLPLVAMSPIKVPQGCLRVYETQSNAGRVPRHKHVLNVHNDRANIRMEHDPAGQLGARRL